MRSVGLQGSVVTLICDGGERYAETYYSDAWVADQGLDLTPHLATIDHFLLDGTWPEETELDPSRGQRGRFQPA